MTDVRNVTHRVRVAYRRTQADISLDVVGQVDPLTRDVTHRLRVGVVRQRERIDFFVLPEGIADALVRLVETRLRVALPGPPVPPEPLGSMWAWTGTEWVLGLPFSWDGTEWIESIGTYSWDGSSWVPAVT